MATVNWSLQHKRDTAANWTANNPTLLAGQLGIETDGLTTTPKFKIGDGVTAWNTLPYFYGGSASAQDLNNVLTVGNSTSGQDIVLTDDDKLQIGSTAGRYIGYDTNLIQIGLGIVNTNSNDHIILQDAGGIHVDTTKVILEQLTASRLLSLNANKEVVNETGTGFLKLTAGVISYDNSSYQPLDADLTSWAGVTRASGFDTFVATPSSANLSSLLTDKTGTGVNVFGTSPTFTTDITTPLIIGGSAVGSTIQYKGTSGNGTSTVAAHQFLVGNNGATTAARIYNSGQVSIGNYASPTNLRLVTIGQDTAYMSFGSLVGSTGNAAIYGTQATPSGTNYTFLLGTNSTGINAPNGNIELNYASTTRYTFASNSVTFSPTTISTGAITNFSFSVSTASGQTASIEIPNFKVTGASKTWAAGNITTQRWNYFTANTAAFASASTITNSYGLYVEAATAGTNATITNNWALGTNGDISINGTKAAKITDTNFSVKFLGSVASYLNPADSTTYYIGTTGYAMGVGTRGKIYVPMNCKIVGFTSTAIITTTVSSSETFTLDVYINGTTAQTLSNSMKLDAVVNVYNGSGLSISLNAGDYIETRILTPAWATNPVGVTYEVTLFLQST